MQPKVNFINQINVKQIVTLNVNDLSFFKKPA